MIFFTPLSWVAEAFFILLFFVLFAMYPVVMSVLVGIFILFIVTAVNNMKGASDVEQ